MLHCLAHFVLHYIQVVCEQLTQIQSDPYFGSENSWWPSLCFALLTRARLLPWLVHCLPALLCQTRLSSRAPASSINTFRYTHILYTHANAAQTPCLAFSRLSTGSSPVAPGLYLSYSTCVSGQSLRDHGLTSLFVCCIDGWGEGTWVQEISTSQIRLINPQLKLLAEESCWIKNQISPGACRWSCGVFLPSYNDTHPQKAAAHGLHWWMDVWMDGRMEGWKKKWVLKDWRGGGRGVERWLCHPVW